MALLVTILITTVITIIKAVDIQKRYSM